jgi:RNA polymerase sigma-70 factor (ECF subfamily)
MTTASEAWRVWLDRHGPALVLLARQWVASRSDAEDIVQEGFIRFWRSQTKAGTSDQPAVAEPAAYLYACVKRCALDWQRGQARRRRREMVTARSEAEPLLAGSLEQEERRQAIEAALRSLPENQAEVLIMKIWGSLTFPQIAAALKISENTAASRYRYALARLREQLAEEPIT